LGGRDDIAVLNESGRAHTNRKMKMQQGREARKTSGLVKRKREQWTKNKPRARKAAWKRLRGQEKRGGRKHMEA